MIESKTEFSTKSNFLKKIPEIARLRCTTEFISSSFPS